MHEWRVLAVAFLGFAVTMLLLLFADTLDLQ